MVMYLIKRRCLQGSWDEGIRQALTKEKDFNTGEGFSKKVPMMATQGEAAYLRSAISRV